MIRWRGLSVCRKTRTMSYAGKAVRMRTQRYAEIAALIVANAGEWTATDRMVELFWGSDESGGPEDIRSWFVGAAFNIRKCLTDIGAPMELINRYGHGYMLASTEADGAEIAA